MPRSLRLSPRPFIAFAVILSPLALIMASLLVRNGIRADLILPSLLPFILYAVTITAICSRSVSVHENGISITSFFILRRFIPFADISKSDVQILAEPDHPISIAIYTEPGMPAATIRLKQFRQDDVAWFCALPQLKIELHR